MIHSCLPTLTTKTQTSQSFWSEMTYDTFFLSLWEKLFEIPKDNFPPENNETDLILVIFTVLSKSFLLHKQRSSVKYVLKVNGWNEWPWQWFQFHSAFQYSMCFNSYWFKIKFSKPPGGTKGAKRCLYSLLFSNNSNN